MNLASTVLSFASTYTVVRQDKGVYDANGKFVPAPTTTISVLASVQPLRGKDLQNLPEGLRNEDLLKVYTTTELRVAGDYAPDAIMVDGQAYEVQTVERWGEFGYWKAIARKRS